MNQAIIFKIKRRYLLKVIIYINIFSLLVAFLGCTKKDTKKVRLVVRTGLESEGLREVAQEFKKTYNIIVEVMELGRENYLSAVPTQLLSGSSKFDVVFLPSTMIAELAKADVLLSLDNKIDVNDTDLIATYGYQNKIFALPCDISTMFLYYRKDLINTPPQTWKEFIEVSKKFSQEINPNSPTKYGCAFPGMAGEDLPKSFYCLLWSYGGFILKENEVGIGQLSSILAAQYLRRLLDENVLPKDITSWSFSQIYENLENGNLAMAAPFWNAAATFLLRSESRFKENIDIALVPGIKQDDGTIKRMSFQHAWTLAVNSKSKNIDEAIEFLAFATGKEGGKLYAKSARGNPARYSILKDPNLQINRPEFKLLIESLQLANSEPSVSYYATLHNIMNEELTQILTKSKNPDEAMKDGGKRIKALVRKFKK